VATGAFPRELAEQIFLKSGKNLKSKYKEIVLRGIVEHVEDTEE